ncbi:MAG: DUF4278 domain-containing protein [Elainellaceae cyanobacterium]
MSLHYRGVVYTPSSTSVKAVETADTVGHYRGATWNIHPATAIQPKRSDIHLKYRGVWVD